MTSVTTTYLCIGCPLGCRLEVEEDGGRIVEIRGFSCKRGREYAEQEHRDPRRMVTTTIRVLNGFWPRLPVRSTAPVPKANVKEFCRAVHTITVKAPVTMGDTIASSVLDTGIDVIATRDMPVGIPDKDHPQ